MKKQVLVTKANDTQLLDLYTILEKILAYHLELLSVVDEEAALPSFTSLETLKRIQEERDATVNKIQQTELQRITAVKVISARFNLKPEITLKELLPYFDSEVGLKFEQIQTELLSLIDRIRKVARNNSTKAKSYLRSLLEMQQEVQKTIHGQPLYSQQGVLNQPKNIGLLQKKYA